MVTLDQFEVEPRCVYSGSTTSRVLYGNTWQNLNSISPGSSASIYRYIVGDRTSGLRTDYRRSLWLYSNMLYYYSGSYVRGNVRHQEYFSEETYFDSYAPNPLEMYMTGLSASNITGAWIDRFALSGNQELGITAVSAETSVIIYIGGQNPGTIGGLVRPILQFTTQYPFESIYKNLRRFFKAGYDQSVIIKSNYRSDGTRSDYTASNIGTLNYVSTETAVAQGGAYIITDATMSSTDQPAKGSSITNGVKNYNSVRPPYDVFSKGFFGIGDGLKASPAGTFSSTVDPVLRSVPTFHDISSSSGYSFAPILRGFKYGLYHCLPRNSKYIFRTGHFGQFRDMLEQPNYSKMKLSAGPASFFMPIIVTFATGSSIAPYVTDYKNATTASWYNPTDSGRFDVEYRSGHPFADDIRIPSIDSEES